MMMKAQNAKTLYLKSQKPSFLFILSIFLFGLLVHLPKAATLIADNINFSFPYFSQNPHGIVYRGDAYSPGKVMQLTANQRDKNMNDSVGRATYFKQMHLWDNSHGNIVLADFSTHFSFAIYSPNSSLKGDGFAFFLASNGTEIPLQSGGGNLGLLSNDSRYNVNSKFVAVEFDTFFNSWDPEMSNHMDIDLNSVVDSGHAEWLWSDFTNGSKVDAFISYNSSTKNLSVFLHDADDATPTKSSSLSKILDLSMYLPEWVTLGFSGSTGSCFEMHTIYSWNFSSSLQVATEAPESAKSPTSPPVNPRSKMRTWSWVVLGVVGAIFALLLVLALVWFFCWRKRYSSREDRTMFVNVDMEMVTAPRKFSFKELSFATSNFADEGLLGEGGFGKVYLGLLSVTNNFKGEKLAEGGFGAVYRGYLRDLDTHVAVKRISKASKQGIKEYASEVKIINWLRHKNLVKLIGWCHENGELILVYEFMANGSLDSHLFKGKSLLAWDVRFKIVQGLASALFYLHEEGDHCVIHRDIKTSNIMLDSCFNAKLGDFGLARLVDHGKGSHTTHLAGTIGYMAPEYIFLGKPSKEADVYSFGVVVLEIACGRRSIEPQYDESRASLIAWVWESYGNRRLLDVTDPKLCLEFDAKQMECLLMVGLWCVHPDHNLRPSMRLAIQVLNFEAPLPKLPGTRPTPIYDAPIASGSKIKTSESSFSTLAITIPR